jgi:hypothetical protein
VQYTDGDREDMDPDEMRYAREFHLQRLGIDVRNETDASGSEDEESYRPSPKVNTKNFHHRTEPPPNPITPFSVEKEIKNQCEGIR